MKVGGYSLSYHHDKKYSKHLYFLSNKNKEVISFCEFEKFLDKKHLVVTYLFVKAEYRGKRLASKMYAAIVKLGFTVVSGYSQNTKSRLLWVNMIKSGKFNITAKDLISKKTCTDIRVDNKGKLKCSLPVYKDMSKCPPKLSVDVRLFMSQ
jgi:hypothetical protein